MKNRCYSSDRENVASRLRGGGVTIDNTDFAKPIRNVEKQAPIKLDRIDDLGPKARTIQGEVWENLKNILGKLI